MEPHQILLGPRTVSRLFLGSTFDLELSGQGIRLPGATALIMQTSRPLLGGQLQPVLEGDACGKVVITPGVAVDLTFDIGTHLWIDCAVPRDGISFGARGVVIVCTPTRQFSLWFAPGAKPRKHPRIAAAEALVSLGYNRAQ